LKYISLGGKKKKVEYSQKLIFKIGKGRMLEKWKRGKNKENREELMFIAYIQI